ncbi:hypothetical protein WNY51_13335 [Pseudocolwellia sp. AS88]|uniref:hypothetical protein n=1 Tax=Pseudocolwellia TaxID=2848177 RepID=UPI0026E97C7C|nr:hypothetical protein [Pseudocolwellia sp. AS88]MDO7083891.1 hypothetical protein [Pseudocolwellia sp. AS88]
MALVSEAPSAVRVRHHISIILLTCIILAAGYHFSMINFLDTEWLSRSGSLVVVLGILSGFSGIIQERILLSRLEMRKRIALLQKRKKLRLLKVEREFVEKELESIETDFAEQASELTQSIKFSVGLIEGVLLMFGTVVWGFGDIALTFLR